MKYNILIFSILATINFINAQVDNKTYQEKSNKIQKNMITNPLLKQFETPFYTADFNKIKPEYFKPAIEYWIQKSNQRINDLTSNKEKPNFKNTLEFYENCSNELDDVTKIFFNLNSAETNDQIQKIAQEISPILANYSNDILFNKKLFARIKSVYDNQKEFNLNQEQTRLLKITYNSFVENGALLSDENQKIKRELDQKLSLYSLKFGENVLKETNDYFLLIEDESKLEGLPENYKQEAKNQAEKKDKKGYLFTLQYPSFIPFMKYVKNRDLRKELYLANGTKAFKNNEYNNANLIKEIAELRQKKAELLGNISHSEGVLKNRMAQNPKNVLDFLDDLLQKSLPFAKQEIEELKILANKDGINEIQAYDHAYYSEKLKEQKFSFNEEEVRPYFSLEKSVDAMFDLANKLFGLEFKIRKDISVYNEEVTVYEVLENGVHKAILYTDFFPRDGKRAGAWMTSFKDQYIENGKNNRPHISIVCNFNRPQGEVPSLLTFQELTTLFHEFGHALHGILANTQYKSLSGTSVYWDFVELPSQFLENYCYEKEFLQTFANHYKTGELIPNELIDKIIKSSNFMEGYQTVRQISLGLLDMKYHTGKLPEDFEVEKFEKQSIKETQIYPLINGTIISSSFSHIFQGGYSSGYYSYKWAEVLDADAFDYFKQNGIFNAEIAKKYKVLLSKGGSEDPMKLYIDFRGQKPKVEALLKRAGLLK